MKTRSYIALAACSYQIPGLGDGAVWLQLTPAGEFRAMDGRPEDVPAWRIDASIAPAVIERFSRRLTPPVIDYEHQTLHKEKNGQKAPAAAWMRELQWREGSGLWVRVDLTQTARAEIEAGQYLYFSPVFSYGADGAVHAILMGALTNDPALDGMEPLAQIAAAMFSHSNPDEDTPVDELLNAIKAALGLKAEATKDDAIAALSALKPQRDADAVALSKVREALGLATDATGEQIAAATAQLTTSPDPKKYAPIAVVTDLQTKLAALTKTVEGDRLNDTVTAALSSGRLLPSMEKWARELGERDPQALEDYIASAAPIAALTKLQGDNVDLTGGGGEALTPERLAALASDYQQAESSKGRRISTSDAVRHIQREQETKQ